VEKEWPEVGDVCLIKRRQDEQATRYVIAGKIRAQGKLIVRVLTEGVPSEPKDIYWSEIETITNPAP
jgi:hypothetical protein